MDFNLVLLWKLNLVKNDKVRWSLWFLWFRSNWPV